MGSMTITPVTPLVGGAAITKTDTGGSTSSLIFAPTTAQSAIGFDKLAIVVENYSTTASCLFTLKAGDDYSSKGQGDNAVTVATNSTVVFGGTNFESARFKDEDGNFKATITTAATALVHATLLPGPIADYTS